jgi:spore coat polysaccharide biosynthesis protein SpsF (cytidylyltransferase family)
MKKIKGKTLIQIINDRLCKSKTINKLIFLTSCSYEDNVIYNHCIENNILCFRGSENNVLERFYVASQINDSDIIIRCTGDCPLLDYRIIDDMIINFKKLNVQYYTHEISNNNIFPDGFGIEIFTNKVLIEAFNNSITDYDKEHVTPYIVRKYNTDLCYLTLGLTLNELQKKYKNINFNDLHLSIDTIEEFNFVENIFKNFDNFYFSCEDVLEYLNKNLNIKKKEYINENLGAQLYIEAKIIIPGGTQLLSKRPEMFLPNYWPSYYQKAKGIEIVTLDGIKMKDFSYMGVGACILGYADDDVNQAVHKAVSNGNLTTLNCPSEVELTKLLLELHPWADMARYSRASGEACSMAVRIARAASGKDKIAFCGYHGWHDWYISVNWNDNDSLDNHLIQGLNPSGVPGSTITKTPLGDNFSHKTAAAAMVAGMLGKSVAVKTKRAKSKFPCTDFVASDASVVILGPVLARTC